MFNRALPVALLALFSTLAACSTETEVEPQAAQDNNLSFFDRPSLPNATDWARGTNWSYETNFVGLPHAWVYRPDGFNKKTPNQRAVIFHLPGCGELPYQIAQGSGWPQVAEDNGFVVVVPEVINPQYPNVAAPNVACYDFGSTGVTQPTRYSTDHAALIKAGADIATKHPELKIDPKQIYLTGISAGGTVAMQVGCMAPDVFAGVGTVAAPSLGTWQMAAVMPPVWNATGVRWGCSYYAQTSPNPKAEEMLGQQVYAIASDDNGLPAGVPMMVWGVWTASKFADQDYWDGDKYIPFAHHRIIADAMAPLFDAKLVKEDYEVPGLSGQGYGCEGGDKSHDDTADVKCVVSTMKKRPWQVKADIWKDAKGRSRIVHLKQDTLRHRWPVGSAGPLDRPVTPSWLDVAAQGYMGPHGETDPIKSAGAPGGTFGVGFFGDPTIVDTFNYTKYLAEHLTANNPRL